MPDYQKGKIYAIRAPGTEEVYIGSTVKKLSERMAIHRSDYKRFLEQKRSYITSFKLIERGDAYIELLEDCPCASKEHLSRREGELIRATAGCVNHYIAGRTHTQYYQEHKEAIIERSKQYYEGNKEAVLEKAKQYYEGNKEAVLEKAKRYREENKEVLEGKNKQYREENKEVLAGKKKQWRDENKEAINARLIKRLQAKKQLGK